METKDFILAISTMFGPVISALIAIYYTRYADKRRITTERKLEVFRNLMKTRGFQLHPDHVMSLNLVQSDFNDDEDVMAKLKSYIDHLYKPIPDDNPSNQRFSNERELLFGQLLVSIARSLKINLAADEVRHFRYTPVGWASTELEQQQVRKLLISVLQGLTPITIRPATIQGPASQPTEHPLFPPPPR